ncbi:Ubiquitin domain-containing protein 2 [Colletotrichum sp. SAR 10_65]|nr:Ubiquitin domain-containing protein 2 [Colletotrichum sp. SAR 10_75]KAI8194781.1 Ubiquitin domain-containing protein 2 [Colletotrichum sp. SAR 10_65]KAI8209985.1 Ubiquitin domain-containing protein 2 [Colletotrichum sp. SAR 10_76]KAI8243616.1 Ubiquitin domain-containing protein 2 [Colletotrichum sp. SAR 10_96]KAI8260638.1 Ubiquitin domain-containing protein 2 [Colletotrichum sp. SAR 10_77]KAI8266695.1 Ubiquitin domain-containing protein 2 [Colletotrichum sp. SAR11_239]KAI8294885.1 Ubiquiti
MGCCMSRSQSGSTSPYPGPTNTGSARAINASTSAAAHDRDDSPAASTTQASSRGRRHRQSTLPLDRHINKPLRRHVWASKSRVWTRSAINRERKDFFETRVTGRPEIWQSLHYALQVLWDPASHGAAEDGTNGLATAQSILDAADITLPTGDLAQGAYDQLGNYYQLNEWAVANPTNLVEDDATIDVADDDEGLSTRDFKDDLAGGEETTEELDEDENVRRREEKGKAVADARDQLSLLARLSENGRDVTVGFSKTDTVKIITGKILNEAGLSPTKKKIRLAFMGKLLKENLPLTEQGWTQGQVINAYVSDR